MHIADLYVAFTARPPLRHALKTRDPFGSLGHVQAFGITVDETWFFFDPNRRRLDLRILHRYDEVEAAISEIHAAATTILRVDPQPGPLLPPVGPITCVAQVAHLAGIRAWTLRGLERKLRSIGAEEVKHENPQGRSGRQAGAGAAEA